MSHLGTEDFLKDWLQLDARKKSLEEDIQYLNYKIDFLPHSQSDTDTRLELEIELCRVGRLIDSLCSRQALSGA